MGLSEIKIKYFPFCNRSHNNMLIYEIEKSSHQKQHAMKDNPDLLVGNSSNIHYNQWKCMEGIKVQVYP